MTYRGRLGWLMSAACAAVILSSATWAQIEEDRAVPFEEVRAAPEVAVLGLSPQQIIEQQESTAAWLSLEAPEGVLDNSIRVRITEAQRFDLDNAPLDEAAITGQSPLKVGVVTPIAAELRINGLTRAGKVADREALAGGILSRTADGGFVWAASFTSEGAGGLRVHVESMQLPPGAELYFYSPRGEAYGPYTAAGPNNDGDLWTNSVVGDTGILQLRVNGPVKAADMRNLSFRVTEIGHISPTFYGAPVGGSNVASFCQYNNSCVQNAMCSSASAVNNAKNAVAKMLWVQGCCIYTCSGGLIADTDAGTQVPYFMTANHCLSSSNASLECFFKYQVSCGTSTCPDQWADPPSNLISGKTLGATIKATGSNGDFSLFQLSQNPPAGSVFLGYNNSAVANTDGLALHRVSHPSGAPQAYSQHTVDTGSPQCTGWERGERIYSQDNTGATEGGSSGSPVVNSSGEFVGQLSGCCGYNCADECDAANNWTVDGALNYYWNSVSSFLNPGGGGGCFPLGATCTSNSQCCSNSCKGRTGAKTCK